tara:strand:+ start:26 stop:943 length:918 start_codon:yes stop_codon:yes gene_type:complete
MANAAENSQFELEVGDAEETEVEVPASEEESTQEVAEVSVSEDSAPGAEAEMEQYSESVQKRINRLTKKMRDAEREREEALVYAKNVQNEAQQIRQRMENLDQGYMSEYGNRLALQQQQAEEALKRAVELGDAEGTVAAQKALTDVSVAANNYSAAQRQAQAYQQAAQNQQYQQPQAYQQPQQPQQPVRPDAKAEDWAGRNAWFGQDEAMTFAAFGIHKKLIEDEGFDPQSDDYYTELDSRIKQEFPHKFGQEQSASRRPTQAVAGVSRSSSSGRGKRVRLSQTQVAIAKKLGVPLEEYAKYVKE